MSAVHAPPTRLCVRCGQNARYGELYLCQACWSNPATEPEIALAEHVGDDVGERRRFIQWRFGWAGGWGREWEAK